MHQRDKFTNKILATLAAIVFIAVVAVFNQNRSTDNSPFGGAANTAVDLIGTRVGTTTTGVSFTSTSTPVVYRKFIGGDMDTAVLTLRATAATAGTANISIFTSNDAYCDTSTTTSVTTPNIADINWFDAAPHISNLAGSTTIAGATTTISWTSITANNNKEIVLTNLNSNCLAVQVAATSTTLWAQLRTKSFK